MDDCTVSAYELDYFTGEFTLYKRPSNQSGLVGTPQLRKSPPSSIKEIGAYSWRCCRRRRTSADNCCGCTPWTDTRPDSCPPSRGSWSRGRGNLKFRGRGFRSRREKENAKTLKLGPWLKKWDGVKTLKFWGRHKLCYVFFRAPHAT